MATMGVSSTLANASVKATTLSTSICVLQRVRGLAEGQSQSAQVLPGDIRRAIDTGEMTRDQVAAIRAFTGTVVCYVLRRTWRHNSASPSWRY